MPSGDLRPFSENPLCPKCGYTVHDVTYRDAQFGVPPIPERLDMACKRCSFQWRMQCKPAAEVHK
jgi:hypothetical protein